MGKADHFGGDSDAGGTSSLSAGLTRVGKFVGTAPYAAPEQWLDAHSAGPAADIYSFGVVFYQMASGKLPFWPSRQGETFADLHLSADPPPVLDRRADLPRAVAEVIHRCLAKGAGERFGGSVEVASILNDEYYQATGRRPPPPAPDDDRRRRDLNNRAVTLVDLGRSHDALAALNEAIEMDALFVRARYNRALLRLRAEQWSVVRAVAEYDNAPPALRRDWRYHYHRGLLHLSAAEFSAAERDLAWVIRRRPNDVDALSARGLSLLLGGEAGPAEACLGRAARLAPGRSAEVSVVVIGSSSARR